MTPIIRSLSFCLLCCLLSPYAFGQNDQKKDATLEATERAADDLFRSNAESDEKRPDPQPIAPPAGKVPLALLKLGTTDLVSPYAFVMDKSSRTLSIWKNNNGKTELVAIHPADVGRQPGSKTSVGDHRTPEGIYFFQKKLDSQRLNLDDLVSFTTMAFTTDYPNFFDRTDNKTGNGIWLHGIPDHVSLWRGSRGCIVVRKNILATLGDYIRLGETPIVMTEKVIYVSPDEQQQKREQLLGWLETWRSSWEGKKIDDYIQSYHPDFTSMGMDKNHWKQFKSSLNEKYSYIKVQVKEPTVFLHHDTAVVRFFQMYDSNKNSDFGEKTLYLKIENDHPQILGEVWTEVSDQSLVRKITTTAIQKTSSSL